MKFKNTITQIINGIRNGQFNNEAEVTNGIVLRILDLLEWDTYNTKQVKPQYKIDNRFIDIALCIPDEKPIIIIEIKSIGKAINTDEQVLTYAFKTGVPVAILTDGQEWHFYFPSGRGWLTERRFYKLDLLERNIEDIIQILQRYLEFNLVENNDAIENAEKDYKKQSKNKEIENSIPLAWGKLLEEKDELLSDLLSEKVADLCGYEPNTSQIFKYLTQLSINSIKYEPVKTKKELKPNLRPKPSRNIQNLSGYKGVKFEGQLYNTKNSIGTLEQILNIIASNTPNVIENISNLTTGRTRKLIAKEINELYHDRPDLVEKSSRKLVNNWWLGTNYSKREIKKFCEIAVSEFAKYSKINIEWEI